MAYNKHGYYKRVKDIQELTDLHFEQGRQDRCRKWVWKKFVQPTFGIGYHAYLKYLKVDAIQGMESYERLAQRKRINDGYYLRVAKAQEIAERFRALGRGGSCKAVWRNHVFPALGISYTTFRNYLTEEIPQDIDITATE